MLPFYMIVRYLSFLVYIKNPRDTVLLLYHTTGGFSSLSSLLSSDYQFMPSSLSLLYHSLQFSISDMDQNCITPTDISCKDQSCCKRLHIFLQIPLQWSCTIHRIVSAFHYKIFCSFCQFDLKFFFFQPTVYIFDQQINMLVLIVKATISAGKIPI